MKRVPTTLLSVTTIIIIHFHCLPLNSLLQGFQPNLSIYTKHNNKTAKFQMFKTTDINPWDNLVSLLYSTYQKKGDCNVLHAIQYLQYLCNNNV